ncbi:MAG: hypothetical protein JRI68_06540 [Deltaproteobacteria bacterium]|nr:hypothetical protein [Deltaproteobacteria bacterium]
MLAPTIEQRRALARAVLRVGRDYRLIAFRAADTHLHLEALCGRAEAGRLANRVEGSLHKTLRYPVRFEPARIWPIADQRHLYNATRYILGQDQRHQLRDDPWAEASNLPDLLGLRTIGHFTAVELERSLPRLRFADLSAGLGLTPAQLTQGDDWMGAIDDLAVATAAAVALPHLEGRSGEVVAARRAAAVATRAAVVSARLVSLLGVSPRTARRLRAEQADPALVEAVRRQLRLRAANRASEGQAGEGRLGAPVTHIGLASAGDGAAPQMPVRPDGP